MKFGCVIMAVVCVCKYVCTSKEGGVHVFVSVLIMAAGVKSMRLGCVASIAQPCTIEALRGRDMVPYFIMCICPAC